MKLILSLGILAVAAVALGQHEDKEHPCGQPIFPRPPDRPDCTKVIERWGHNHPSGECKSFSYNGCDKNENNFQTKDKCDKFCKEWHESHGGHHGHALRGHDGHHH